MTDSSASLPDRAAETVSEPESTSVRRPTRWWAPAAVFLGAVAIRAAILANPQWGNDFDLGIFTRWIRQLIAADLGTFYATESFCDYPPLAILLMKAAGHVGGWITGPGIDEAALRMCVKGLSCVADLAIGITLFAFVRQRLGRSWAISAAALYLFNPVVLYDGAFWGQVDAVHTFFVLLTIIWAGSSPLRCGAALALALTAKFQSIAFAPLAIFEVYRRCGWRGLGGMLLGSLVAAGVVLAPFAARGVLTESLNRSYVKVVGQYHERSRNAYNLWQLTGNPGAADTHVPAPVVRLAAGDAATLPADGHPLLHLTWRRVSLVLYSLAVAGLLTLYSLRAGGLNLFLAASVSALAFFLFPTEMHERYAFPLTALLVPWAITGLWRERTYVLLSACMLLNLAAVQPPEQLAEVIALVNLVLFGGLAVLLITRRTLPPPTADTPPIDESTDATPPRLLIRVFTWLTATAWIAACVAVVTGIWMTHRQLPRTDLGVTYVGTLHPIRATQGWGSLRADEAVSGSIMRMNDVYYLLGVGTHAPSRLIYTIPPNAEKFRALVGIDDHAGGPGSAAIEIRLDGQKIYEQPRVTAVNSPVEIEIPLLGAAKIELLAHPTADGQRCDHVNWALAAFITESGS